MGPFPKKKKKKQPRANTVQIGSLVMFIIIVLILSWELINMVSYQYTHCFLLAFQDIQMKTFPWALGAAPTGAPWGHALDTGRARSRCSTVCILSLSLPPCSERNVFKTSEWRIKIQEIESTGKTSPTPVGICHSRFHLRRISLYCF